MNSFTSREKFLIKELVKEKGLKFRKIADKAKVTKGAVSNYFDGNHNSPKITNALYEILNIPT